MRSTPVLLLAVLGMLFTAAAAGAKLYKWVDKDGNVSYHDRPPPAEGGYKVEERDIGAAEKTKADGAEEIAAKFPVVLYSIPVCGSCDLARTYLQKRKVPFSEVNLESDPKVQETARKKFGSLSVPIITIGEKVMKGYLESLLEGELDQAGYPKPEAAPPAASSEAK